MVTLPQSKRLLEGVLSIGRTSEESDSRRSGRRVFMLAFIIATLFSVPPLIARFSDGYTWVGGVDLVTLVIPVVILAAIAIRPRSYTVCLHTMFAVLLARPLLDTAIVRRASPLGVARDLRSGRRARHIAGDRPSSRADARPKAREMRSRAS
jgi:hypothetical protein